MTFLKSSANEGKEILAEEELCTEIANGNQLDQVWAVLIRS